jgi:hypothetical protein
MTKTVETLKADIASAFASRIAYEQNKNADNASIVKKFTAIAKSADHDTIASVLLACNYDAANINASNVSTHRANVYMIEKQIDFARYLANVDRVDQYSVAIFKSTLALETAQIEMTRKAVASACSADVKHTDAKTERVLKTTRVQKHIAASTVSTQASSSLCMLTAFNVLTETRNASNESVFRVNRESEAAKRFAARLEIELTSAAQ